jgi:UDP-glucose 4-epimerase
VVVRSLLQREDIQVVGVDVRNWLLDRPPRFRFEQLDLRRSPAEDLFRTLRPHGIVHLAFINKQSVPRTQRHEVNVVAAQKVLNWAVRYKARKVVTLSRSLVYGAHPENPILIEESHPLKLGVDYPELADLIEFDHVVRSFLFRYPQTRTVLLRSVEVVGPNVRNGVLSRYLSMPRPPVAMGFDPMVQLVHEEDVSQAITLALQARANGIYNVAGPGSVPLRRLLDEIGVPIRILPTTLLKAADGLLWRLGRSPFPPAAVDLLRYSFVVNDARLRRELKYRPRRGLLETIRSIRRDRAAVLA